MLLRPTLTAENGASNKLESAPAGSFVGRMQYAPTRDNKKQRTNNKKARYPAKLAGIPDALIFFSFPFLASRQEKERSPQKMRETLTTKKPGTRRKNPATHPAFFTFRLGRYALSLSDVGDRNNIGKHTRCGHVGTGAVALDNHRILVITLGGDHNNVVASLQFVERMGATNFL